MELSQTELDCIKATLAAKGYEDPTKIGSGGYAHVFKVYSDKYKQHFAAKVLCIGTPELSKNIPSFSAEVGALSTVYHQNVINIYAQFSDSQHLYIILELCPGGSVLSLLKKNGAFDPHQVLIWLFQIASALSACHQMGIAHRDMKPANILFDANCRPKLADFGLSVTSDRRSFSHRFGGSKPYSSPEVMRGNKHDPFKADIWSLGITFYVIATGNLPYHCTTDEELCKQIINPKISFPEGMNEAMKTLLSSMLEVDPAMRPSCAKLLENPIFDPFKNLPNRSLMKVSSKSNSVLSLSGQTIVDQHSSGQCKSFAQFHAKRLESFSSMQIHKPMSRSPPNPYKGKNTSTVNVHAHMNRPPPYPKLTAAPPIPDNK